MSTEPRLERAAPGPISSRIRAPLGASCGRTALPVGSSPCIVIERCSGGGKGRSHELSPDPNQRATLLKDYPARVAAPPPIAPDDGRSEGEAFANDGTLLSVRIDAHPPGGES